MALRDAPFDRSDPKSENQAPFTVSAVYGSMQAAKRAMADLKSAGIPADRISGSMDEAKREGGVLVEVKCADGEEAGQAATVLGRANPLRIERLGPDEASPGS